ncbi:MAG: tetratricopeptide repeat protein [Spirosomataceae bacterium]
MRNQPVANASSPPAATGQTWALVVGVSQYQNVTPLRFASADAEAFYQYLLSPASGSVPVSNIQLLLNEKATLGQIDRALGNLLDMVKPNDRVFLYFSGHGDQESKTIAQRGFLLTYNASAGNYNSTAFPVIYLKDYVMTLSTKNKAQVFLFLDACRSGKLAGTEIGGVQLVGQQLIEQVSNEVKFMACQANELSLEGYQWGGGRGLFSYHLIRGMQGLADADKDKTITLRELERYIEDHVTPEAAPNRQNPLLIAADKSIPLLKVDEPTLAAIQKNLPPPAFVAVQGKGFSETALNAASPEVRDWHSSFQKAIAQKQLIDLPNSAENYFKKLLAIPALADLHPFIKREFAAALMEESTQFFNAFLKNQQATYTNDDFRKNTKYLERASEILGKSHHLYPNLRAQIAYYNGLAIRPTNANEALIEFRRSIALDSAFSPAYNDLGVLLYRKKAYQEAQTVLEKGLIYAPSWSFLQLNYGMVLAAQQQWAAAETAYKKTIELAPDNAVVFKNYGNLLVQQNRMIEAEVAYKKSIGLDTNDPETYNNYGMLLNTEKRYTEAEEWYKKALEIQPNNAQVHSNYGIVLTVQNRLVEAEVAFQKSIQINPKDAQVYFNYGILLATQNRPIEAENNYKKSINLNPSDATVYNSYGVLLAAQNRFAEAEIAYKKYIELNPKNALVYGNYGNLLARQNRRQEAEVAYKKAIELNPEDANVHKNYGILLKNLNRLAEAEVAYKKAIQLHFDDADLYRNYGMLLSLLKRPDEAEIAYKKSIDLSPNDAYVFNSYGILLAAKSRWKEAEEAYQKAIAIDSTLGLVYSNYANLLARQERAEDAEKAYQKASSLITDDANLYNNYGYFLEIQNRDDEATKIYEKSIEVKNNNPNVDYYSCLYQSPPKSPNRGLRMATKSIGERI